MAQKFLSSICIAEHTPRSLEICVARCREVFPIVTPPRSSALDSVMWSYLCLLCILLFSQLPPDILRGACEAVTEASSSEPQTDTTGNEVQDAAKEQHLPGQYHSQPWPGQDIRDNELPTAIFFQIVQFVLLSVIYGHRNNVKRIYATSADTDKKLLYANIEMGIATVQVLYSLGGCARLYTVVQGDYNVYRAPNDFFNLWLAGVVFVFRIPFICMPVIYRLFLRLPRYPILSTTSSSRSDSLPSQPAP